MNYLLLTEVEHHSYLRKKIQYLDKKCALCVSVREPCVRWNWLRRSMMAVLRQSTTTASLAGELRPFAGPRVRCERPHNQSKQLTKCVSFVSSIIAYAVYATVAVTARVRGTTA